MLIMLDYVDGHDDDTRDETDDDDHHCHRVEMALLATLVMSIATLLGLFSGYP